MDLILFYANGTTFRFQQVQNFIVKDNEVEFDYFGQSTQTHRHGKFTGIVGYSTENKPIPR